MKKYSVPQIEINYFDADDIMTGSSEQISWIQQGAGDSLGFGDLMGAGF